MKLQSDRKGFISLEISLALIIAAIVAYFGLQQLIRSSTTDIAAVQATQLTNLKNAVNSYINVNRVRIAGTQAVPYPTPFDSNSDGTAEVSIPYSATGGDGSTIQPTVRQMVGLQLLPPGFNAHAIANNGTYRIRLNVLPVGCNVAPSDPNTCRIEGYIYLDRPVVKSTDNVAAGQYDGQFLGEILSKLGGDGFASIARNQNLVSAGGDFQIALPPSDQQALGNALGTGVATTPAGLVGVRVGSFASTPSASLVPNVDYCPGNPKKVTWGPDKGAPSCSGDNPNNYCTVNLDTTGNTPAKYCEGLGYSDIPVGLESTTVDFNPPVLGQIRLKCTRAPGSTVATVSVVLTNTSCN